MATSGESITVDERRPLLGPPRPNSNSINTRDSYSDDDDDYSAVSDGSEIDEAVLDSFAARFGTSMGTLGLDGGAPTTLPIRRFSMSQEYGASVRRLSQVLDRQDMSGGRRMSYSTSGRRYHQGNLQFLGRMLRRLRALHLRRHLRMLKQELIGRVDT